MPCALTIAQMKNATPATGTTYALKVKRCLILWTGNQIAGRLHNQKIKKLTKSLVLVPEFAGMLFGKLSQLFQMLRIIKYTQVPVLVHSIS